MRHFPETVLASAALVAVYELCCLRQALGWAASSAFRQSESAVRLLALPFLPLLGSLLLAGAGVMTLAYYLGHRLPRGWAVAVGLTALCATVIGETYRLMEVCDPEQIPFWWNLELGALLGTLSEFRTRLAVGAGLSAGCVLGAVGAVIHVRYARRRGPACEASALPGSGKLGRRLRLVGSALWLAAVCGFPPVVADSMIRMEWSESRTPLTLPEFLSLLRLPLGGLLVGASLGLHAFLVAWLFPATGRHRAYPSATAVLRPPRPRFRSPMDIVRWLLVGGVLVSFALGAGLFDLVGGALESWFGVGGDFQVLLRVQSVGLFAMLLWALSLTGEPGTGTLPRRWASGTAQAAVGSGLVLLLLSVCFSRKVWPIVIPEGSGWGDYYNTWPFRRVAASLRLLTAGGIAVVVGSLAAGGILLFKHLGVQRWNDGEEPGGGMRRGGMR